MLSPNLQRFAEQIASGEIPSLQDEEVIAGLYATLTPDSEERAAARWQLKRSIAGPSVPVAPVVSRPVLVRVK